MEKPKTFSCAKKIFLAVCAAAAALASCDMEVGLGEAIDQEAPRLSVAQPENNQTVSQIFTMKGEAADNDDVTKITVDSDEADIHFLWDGGDWKMKTHSSDWKSLSQPGNYCRKENGVYKWSIQVDLKTDADPAKTDSSYELSAVATDKMGNTSKNSKVEISLTIDEKNPRVSVNEPVLLSGDFSAAKATSDGRALCDGAVVSKLLNGDIKISGIQQGPAMFEELMVELDDGALSSGVAKYTADADLGNVVSCADVKSGAPFDGETSAPKVYLAKTKKRNEKFEGETVSDLRNWDFTIKADELISQNPELSSGRHLIRVVTTSVSASAAWERKVQGYFTWWPEADKPWIVAFSGGDDEAGAQEIYPSGALSGYAMDDDGIQKIVCSIKAKGAGDYSQNYGAPKEFSADENSGAQTRLDWTLQSPSETGDYCLVVDATDANGKSAERLKKYFKTLDVKAPKINIEADGGIFSLADENGDMTFSGSVSDDGSVKNFYLAHLDPAKRADVSNKVKFMDGSAAVWKTATAAGADDGGNTIYDLSAQLSNPSQSKDGNVYAISKTLNLFADLKIDGGARELSKQSFVFCAIDNGGSSSTKVIDIEGDSEKPLLKISTVKISGGAAQSLGGETPPTLAQFTNNDTAVFSGSWSDDSILRFADKTKIKKIEVAWNGLAAKTVAQNFSGGAGTWTAAFDAPLPKSTAAVITASLTDFGGNTQSASATFYVENSEVALQSAGSDNDDGAFKAGEEIVINLEFNKSVKFSGGAADPSLTLDLGGGKTATAVYESGNAPAMGSATHKFKYTVGANDDTGGANIDVKAVNYTGVWQDVSVSPPKNVDMTLPRGQYSLGAGRNIKVDTTSPKIFAVTAKTNDGSYKKDSSIIIAVEFSEAVEIADESALSLSLSAGPAAKADGASAQGGKTLLFTYTVGEGENANPLKINSLAGDWAANIKDLAGNALDGSFSAKNLDGVIIDTTPPAAPAVALSGAGIVKKSAASFAQFSDGGSVTVEITPASDTIKKIECATNKNGAPSWKALAPGANGKYSFTISENGEYRIAARQTDAAGNTGAASGAQTLVVDKGDLFKGLSVDTTTTTNGSYTYHTGSRTGDTIDGVIMFRKKVKIPLGATVTLKVGNLTLTGSKCEITTAGDTATDTHKFSYTVESNVANGAKGRVDVAAWSFSSVTTEDGAVVPMDFSSAVTAGKKFTDNCEVYILTGKPSVLSATGFGADNKTLTINFDREISTHEGCITIAQKISGYRAPAVLSEERYNSLLSKGFSDIGDWYEAGTNGATKNGADYTADTSKKYVLKFEKSTEDPALAAAFIAAKWNEVKIPSYDNAVKIGADKKTVTVSLEGSYALPVKGADYSVKISEGFAQDEMGNANEEFSAAADISASGVESPFIRIEKKRETWTGVSRRGGQFDALSDVVATQPMTAQVKIDCHTPGATIDYETSGWQSNQKTCVGMGRDQYGATNDTNEAADEYDGAIEATPIGSAKCQATARAAKSAQANGVTFEIGGNDAIAEDVPIPGRKIFIDATASKGGAVSEEAHEAAYRATLTFKFKFGRSSSKVADDSANANGYAGSGLTMRDLSMWVRGSDGESTAPTTPGFPLAWDTGSRAGIRLMSEKTPGGMKENPNAEHEFYWVSWEINVPSYFLFYMADVPSDADASGPTLWYKQADSFTNHLASHKLFPGESLKMWDAHYNSPSSANIRFRAQEFNHR